MADNYSTFPLLLTTMERFDVVKRLAMKIVLASMGVNLKLRDFIPNKIDILKHTQIKRSQYCKSQNYNKQMYVAEDRPTAFFKGIVII